LTLSDDISALTDLKSKRKFWTILFLIFVVVPLPVATIAFSQIEGVGSLPYDRAFFFSFQKLTGVDTNSTYVPHSNWSVALVTSLGLLKLAFLGLGAAIIVASIDIAILERKMPPAPPGQGK